MREGAGWLKTRVVRKDALTPNISAFELQSLDGSMLPAFEAGAHIDVQVPGGPVRQYSLCNAPGETHRYEIAVLREPHSRGGSIGMHALCVGQTLEICAPRNHFPLALSARHHVLFAGGIGVTPLLAMAQALAQKGSSFEMHYCTRSCATTAFRQRIVDSNFSDRVVFYHDEGCAAARLDVHALLRSTPSQDAHLYVCGPTGFMDWVLTAGRGAGWSEERLHREYFVGAPTQTDSDNAFEVQIASTGKVISVAADQSVTAALAENGIQVATSCGQGVCGTCVLGVLAGTPDHRDMYLTDIERALNNQFTPCCSRSKSTRLLLDL